MRGLYNEQ